MEQKLSKKFYLVLLNKINIFVLRTDAKNFVWERLLDSYNNFVVEKTELNKKISLTKFLLCCAVHSH